MKNKKLLTMVLAAAMVVGSITVPAPMATVKADTVTTSRTNILREDGVVVSQQHGSARSLIDGDITTVWDTNGWNGSQAGFPGSGKHNYSVWAEFTLADYYNVSDFNVWFKDETTQKNTAWQYKIEASIDNSNWDLVVDQTENTVTDKHFENIVGKDYKNKIYKYVKVTIVGAKTDMKPWPAMTEFAAYGERATALTSDQIAKGTESSVSIYNPGNVGSNAIDGDVNTSWIANGWNDKEASYGDVTSEGTTANYVVELKKMTKVNALGIFFAGDAKSSAWKYKVEGSVDGTEYTTIWDQSTNEVNAGSNGEQFTNIEEGTYKYIRLKFTEPIEKAWPAVAEICIYGNQLSNLSLGKTAKGSSENRPATNANDGNKSSLWVADGNTEKLGSWWKVDLGGLKSFDSFEIAFEYAVNEKRDDADANNNPLYGLPHKYEVRGGGEAAENWSDEQWDKADLLWSGSQMTKEATGKISDKFKNKNYRYIRVKLTGIPHHKANADTDDNHAWAEIAEFTVYGEATAEHKVVLNGTTETTVADGATYELGDAKYGYYSDGKVYAPNSEITVNDDIYLTAISDVSLKLANAAAIRIDAGQEKPGGIRFKTEVSATTASRANEQKVKNVICENAGTLITVNDVLKGATLDLAKKDDLGKNFCADVVNTGWYRETNDTYCASLINIVPANYTRFFNARAYANIPYENADATTVYSEDGAGEGYTGTVSKSIQGIASIIQKKGYPNIDEGLHNLIDEFAKENQNNN